MGPFQTILARLRAVGLGDGEFCGLLFSFFISTFESLSGINGLTD